MQLLLTGKKRFDGFSGEWKEVFLKRAAEINPETDKLPKQFYYIDLESVKRGQLIKQKLINKDDSPSRAQRLLSKGDVSNERRKSEKTDARKTPEKESMRLLCGQIGIHRL